MFLCCFHGFPRWLFSAWPLEGLPHLSNLVISLGFGASLFLEMPPPWSSAAVAPGHHARSVHLSAESCSGPPGWGCSRWPVFREQTSLWRLPALPPLESSPWFCVATVSRIQPVYTQSSDLAVPQGPAFPCFQLLTTLRADPWDFQPSRLCLSSFASCRPSRGPGRHESRFLLLRDTVFQD